MVDWDKAKEIFYKQTSKTSAGRKLQEATREIEQRKTGRRGSSKSQKDKTVSKQIIEPEPPKPETTQEDVTLSPREPVYVTWEKPSGDVTTTLFKAGDLQEFTGYRKGDKWIPGTIETKYGGRITEMSKPGGDVFFKTTTGAEWQKMIDEYLGKKLEYEKSIYTGVVPADISKQIDVPGEIARAGASEEYIKLSYEKYLGLDTSGAETELRYALMSSKWYMETQPLYGKGDDKKTFSEIQAEEPAIFLQKTKTGEYLPVYDIKQWKQERWEELGKVENLWDLGFKVVTGVTPEQAAQAVSGAAITVFDPGYWVSWDDTKIKKDSESGLYIPQKNIPDRWDWVRDLNVTANVEKRAEYMYEKEYRITKKLGMDDPIGAYWEAIEAPYMSIVIPGLAGAGFVGAFSLIGSAAKGAAGTAAGKALATYSAYTPYVAGGVILGVTAADIALTVEEHGLDQYSRTKFARMGTAAGSAIAGGWWASRPETGIAAQQFYNRMSGGYQNIKSVMSQKIPGLSKLGSQISEFKTTQMMYKNIGDYPHYLFEGGKAPFTQRFKSTWDQLFREPRFEDFRVPYRYQDRGDILLSQRPYGAKSYEYVTSWEQMRGKTPDPFRSYQASETLGGYESSWDLYYSTLNIPRVIPRVKFTIPQESRTYLFPTEQGIKFLTVGETQHFVSYGAIKPLDMASTFQKMSEGTKGGNIMGVKPVSQDTLMYVSGKEVYVDYVSKGSTMIYHPRGEAVVRLYSHSIIKEKGFYGLIKSQEISAMSRGDYTAFSSRGSYRFFDPGTIKFSEEIPFSFGGRVFQETFLSESISFVKQVGGGSQLIRTRIGDTGNIWGSQTIELPRIDYGKSFSIIGGDISKTYVDTSFTLYPEPPKPKLQMIPKETIDKIPMQQPSGSNMLDLTEFVPRPQYPSMRGMFSRARVRTGLSQIEAYESGVYQTSSRWSNVFSDVSPAATQAPGVTVLTPSLIGSSIDLASLSASEIMSQVKIRQDLSKTQVSMPVVQTINAIGISSDVKNIMETATETKVESMVQQQQALKTSSAQQTLLVSVSLQTPIVTAVVTPAAGIVTPAPPVFDFYLNLATPAISPIYNLLDIPGSQRKRTRTKKRRPMDIMGDPRWKIHPVELDSRILEIFI